MSDATSVRGMTPSLNAGTRRLRHWPFAVAVASLAAAFAACSTPAPAQTLCTPDKEYFCRCVNPLEDGVKKCNAEGTAYAACLPCPLSEGPYDGGAPDDVSSLCGNGKIDRGENCDDGNRIDTDLCNNYCVPQGIPQGSCPALPIYLWDRFETYSETSGTGSFQSYAGCSGASGSTSPERVYEITPDQTGLLKITVASAQFDHMIYVRKDCAVAGSERGCVNGVTGNGGETLTVSVSAKQKAWVVVDGVRQASGSFAVQFELLVPATKDAGADAKSD
jgi:cysteine-rich repeat protein